MRLHNPLSWNFRFNQLLFCIGLLLTIEACTAQNSTPVSRLPTQPLPSLVPSSTFPIELSSSTPLPVENTPSPIVLIAPITAVETPQVVEDTPMPETKDLTITIVFDNYLYDQRLSASWGFSALVEYKTHTVLFDTGGDGSILLQNMRILGIDPARIESIVLSHAHNDHTGGLSAILNTGIQPVVYLLPSFPTSMKWLASQTTQAVEVSPGLMIAEGISTTGEMPQDVPEQALVLQTDAGLVLITGCAHPGIVEIVEQAKELFTQPVYLVMGGFHLGSKSQVEIQTILGDFRRLGVEKVAPSHCTGDNAITLFEKEYGKDFIQSGAGKVIEIGDMPAD